MASNIASVYFNAHYEADRISRASSLLFLYGTNQEDLLSTYDAIISLPDVCRTPSTILSLEQIDIIRKGNGLKVENFLLA